MATTFTAEQLELKGRDEVRRLCTSLGIMGYSKARKDECIDAILSQYGGQHYAPTSRDLPEPTTPLLGDTSALSAMQYHVTSAVTDPTAKEGDRIGSTLTVLCGALSRQFNVVGYTVSEVSQFLKEALNIDSMSNAMVDGKEVKGDYKLTSRDTRLEFIKPAGSKGC